MLSIDFQKNSLAFIVVTPELFIVILQRQQAVSPVITVLITTKVDKQSHKHAHQQQTDKNCKNDNFHSLEPSIFQQMRECSH